MEEFDWTVIERTIARAEEALRKGEALAEEIMDKMAEVMATELMYDLEEYLPDVD